MVKKLSNIFLDSNKQAFYIDNGDRTIYPTASINRVTYKLLDFIISFLPSIIFIMIYRITFNNDPFYYMFDSSSIEWMFLVSSVLAIVFPILFLIAFPYWYGVTPAKKIFKQEIYTDSDKFKRHNYLLRELFIIWPVFLIATIGLFTNYSFSLNSRAYNDLINHSYTAITSNNFEEIFPVSTSITMSDFLNTLQSNEEWKSLITNEAISIELQIKSIEALIQANEINYDFFSKIQVNVNIGDVEITNYNLVNFSKNYLANTQLVGFYSYLNIEISETAIKSSYVSLSFVYFWISWIIFNFFIIAFLKQKRGLHDFLFNTIVIDSKMIYTREQIGEISKLDLEKARFSMRPKFIVANKFLKMKKSNKEIKNYFSFDLDNTLLNSEGKISQNSKKALRMINDNGDIFVLNTGRALSDTTKFLNEVNGEYSINLNGCLIHNNHSKETVYQKFFNENSTLKLLEYTMKNKVNFKIYYENSYEYYMDSKLKKLFDENFHSYLNLENNIFDLKDKERVREKGKITKFIYMYLNKDSSFVSKEKNRLEKEVGSFAEIYDGSYSNLGNNVNLRSIEISVKDTSKQTGNEILKSILNIDSARIISFGDSDNDYLMLKSSDVSVAMKNSTKKILNIKGIRVIGDNNSDAIYNFIKEFYKDK